MNSCERNPASLVPEPSDVTLNGQPSYCSDFSTGSCDRRTLGITKAFCCSGPHFSLRDGGHSVPICDGNTHNTMTIWRLRCTSGRLADYTRWVTQSGPRTIIESPESRYQPILRLILPFQWNPVTVTTIQGSLICCLYQNQ